MIALAAFLFLSGSGVGLDVAALVALAVWWAESAARAVVRGLRP